MFGRTAAKSLATFCAMLVLLVCAQQSRAQTLNTLLDEADSLLGAENADSAIAIGKLALEQAEMQFGEEDTVVARVLHSLANYNLSKFFMDDLPLVESYLKRSLAIRIKYFGDEHTDVAATLASLAVLYANYRRYAEAEPLFTRALSIFERLCGPDDPRTVKMVENMGIHYLRQGKYAQAEPFFLKYLASLERTLGPDHPDVALCLMKLAGVYLEQGKYDKAESLYLRSLSTSKSSLGPDHPLVAECLNGLGCIRMYQGEYAQAEAFYSQSLSIMEKNYGPDHLALARELGNLATLSFHLGQYAEAESLLKRCLTVTEKALTPKHPDVAAYYSSLSDVYMAQGRLDDAKAAAQRSLTIREDLFGTEHLQLVNSLTRLAEIDREMGDYAEAETAQRQSLDIVERVLGLQHPKAATCMAGLASILQDRGMYAEADSLYKLSLGIFDASVGSKHPNVAVARQYKCGLYRILGRHQEALDLAEQAYHIMHNCFDENGIVLSERDALTFSRSFRDAGNLYLTCFSELSEQDRTAGQHAADVILSCKGNVTDRFYSRQRAIVEEQDSTLVSLAESLRLAKYQLSKYFVEGPGDDFENYKYITDSLNAAVDRLDAELSRRSASFRRQKDLADVSLDRVSDMLPENAVLIEFFRYNRYQIASDSARGHYAALVIGGEDTSAIVGLGEASEIDSLVGSYRGHMARTAAYGTVLDEDQIEYSELSAALFRKVWQPIERFTANRELVLIAPDGALNLISFAGLQDPAGEYLIERFAIHYLSCGRDIIRIRQPHSSASGLFALGDPDFDASVPERLDPNCAAGDSLHAVSMISVHSLRSSGTRLRETVLSPLPGTRSEIERIKSCWENSIEEPVVVCLGSAATEDRFKAEAPGNRVIHLATHGYYLGSSDDNSFRLIDPAVGADYVDEDPLLLSGLFFAGANHHGDGADSVGIDDGILTSCEVSAMDLTGTDLVVLSACETGLGEVEEGEGAYGLRRAFLMAGARAVISALWPVSDQSTADVMSRLYQQNNESLADKFRTLQLQRLRELRSKGQSDHPVAWAGFVATGDWR